MKANSDVFFWPSSSDDVLSNRLVRSRETMDLIRKDKQRALGGYMKAFAHVSDETKRQVEQTEAISEEAHTVVGDNSTPLVRLQRIAACIGTTGHNPSVTPLSVSAARLSKVRSHSETHMRNLWTEWHTTLRKPNRRYALARWLTYFAFILPTCAQPTSSGSTEGNHNWKMQRVNTLTEDVLAIFHLLYPPAVFLGTVWAARRFRRKGQDGRAAMWMLIMVFIFAGVASEEGKAEYARLAVGLGYAYLMATYCKLVAVKNNWRREGCCAFAGALAISTVIVALSFAPVRAYLAGLAGTSVVFALSLAVPLAVAVCDVATSVLPRIAVTMRVLCGIA